MRLGLRTLVLSCAAAVSSLAMAAPTVTYHPGTYSATVNGHNAPMTVTVTVSKDRIEKIDTTQNLETVGVGKVALAKMTDKVLTNQSLGVDAITGATVTSSAFYSAVMECLKQAQVSDLQALKKKVEQPAVGTAQYEADVVVIGGGGAGLASAISAWQAGAKKVIVLEKLGILGGSTNVSEGALNAVDPIRQPKQGIEDSVEKFYDQTMKGGHNVGTPELVAFLTQHAMESVKWMESLGVEFKDEVGTATGALWQRSHYPATPSGNHYIQKFEKVIADSNGAIEVLTDTQALEILMKNGKVAGVQAKHQKQDVTVHADAVIIATGGFGANVKFRQEVNTGVWKHVVLDDKIGSTNMQKAAQGEGLLMGQKVGAKLIGLSDIQLHPCGTPGTGLMENIRTSGRNRVFVNETGARFVNEGAARDVLANAIIRQPHSTYWVVVNNIRYPSRDFVDSNGATIRDMVALGSVVEANTLEELAQKTGMNLENLQKSIEQYNNVVSGKRADPFGFKADNKADKLLRSGPWYACKKVPTVHHTMGGLAINVNAQVLNTQGQPIPGLFAAGEVTGGIHGSNRLGGNAIADCMTFGRVAGRQAAKY